MYSVQLELGLLEDASLKFDEAMQGSKANISASYGVACCSLLLANKNIEDGKFGSALEMLSKGIKAISSFVNEECNCTILKLLGDLYSHGYKLPLTVFGGIDLHDIKSKQQFLEKGYVAYESCLETLKQNVTKTGNDLLTSSILSDMASNLMLQAQFQMNRKNEVDEKVLLLLTRAREHYSKAIQLNELDASLWCGLGCSLFHLDQILSQHAFCRAAQLDTQYADAWANLGFSYAERSKFIECEAAINVLTQVADTPLMWILRGIVLEKTATDTSDAVEKFQNASDAYRACLQTSQNQSALLGLASTCRRCGIDAQSTDNIFKNAVKHITSRESYSSLSLFLSASDKEDALPHFLYKIMEIESGKDDIECSVFNDLVEYVENFNQSCSTNYLADEKEQTLNLAQSYVHMNPDDGEGWLRLAKRMVMEFTQLKSPSEHQRNLMIDTVRRANLILKGAVVEPVTVASSSIGNVQKSVVVRAVKATELSDAEVLSSWVQDHVSERESSKCLQRALLLDPENRIARVKLLQ